MSALRQNSGFLSDHHIWRGAIHIPVKNEIRSFAVWLELQCPTLPACPIIGEFTLRVVRRMRSAKSAIFLGWSGGRFVLIFLDKFSKSVQSDEFLDWNLHAKVSENTNQNQRMDRPGYKNLAFFVFSLFFLKFWKKTEPVFTILIQYFSTPTFTHEFILFYFQFW